MWLSLAGTLLRLPISYQDVRHKRWGACTMQQNLPSASAAGGGNRQIWGWMQALKESTILKGIQEALAGARKQQQLHQTQPMSRLKVFVVLRLYMGFLAAPAQISA